MRHIFPLGTSGLGDAELVSAVRAGDADAYAELSARHIEAARRLARQLVASDAVDGLVEEAFAKVRLVLQRGDGPDLAFRPYLLTAVRRLHVDHTPTADPEVAESHEDAAAARAFSSLPEPWRMVLWHTEVEGQSPDQVAELLGERPESVPALVTRAREGMRIALISRHDRGADQECDWTRHHLGAYVRQVSFDRDTARVERHLGSCERCAAIRLELTEGSTDVRGVLAPLVLGTGAAGYLVDSESAAASRPVAVAGARTRRRVGAVTAGVTGLFAGAVDGVRGAAAATASVPSRVADAVGVRMGLARDLVADRTAATAVAGVAAIVVVGGGIFVVGQTIDGPVEASAEAPLGIVLDDHSSAPTETSDTEKDDAPRDRLGEARSIVLPGTSITPSASGSASDDPTEAASETPTLLPSATPGLPAPAQPSGEPTRPGQEPSQHPTRPPTQQPSQTPTQPTRPPTQPPTQAPTQPPAPPTDLSISASSNDLAGLFWSIEVRVTGLAPGRTATLVAHSTGGNATGMSSDQARCTRTSGGGATCRVNKTPATFRFGAQALLGGPNTLTFTVYPDGDTDANTSDNSTSVTIRA